MKKFLIGCFVISSFCSLTVSMASPITPFKILGDSSADLIEELTAESENHQFKVSEADNLRASLSKLSDEQLKATGKFNGISITNGLPVIGYLGKRHLEEMTLVELVEVRDIVLRNATNAMRKDEDRFDYYYSIPCDTSEFSGDERKLVKIEASEDIKEMMKRLTSKYSWSALVDHTRKVAKRKLKIKYDNFDEIMANRENTGFEKSLIVAVNFADQRSNSIDKELVVAMAPFLEKGNVLFTLSTDGLKEEEKRNWIATFNKVADQVRHEAKKELEPEDYIEGLRKYLLKNHANHQAMKQKNCWSIW